MTRRTRLTREGLSRIFGGGVALRQLQNHPRRLIGRLPMAAEIPPSIGTPGNLLVRARLVREVDPTRIKSPRSWTAMVREVVPHQTVLLALRDGAGEQIHISPPLETDGAGMLEHILDSPGDTATVSMIVSGEALPQQGPVRLVDRDGPLLATIADVDRTFIGSKINGFLDLGRLMREPGRARPWIDGTQALATGWQGRGATSTPRAWVFLTGSPWFFLGNLSDAADAAGLHLDGLFPRPGAPPQGVRAWHPEHIRRAFENLGRQAGYKLSTTLRLCATLPRQSRLVLLGDDAESDTLAYVALSRWLDGSWSEEEILRRVLPRAGAFWRPSLEAALEETRELRGPSVTFIGIRRTKRARHPEDVNDLPPASVVHDTTDELEAAMKRFEVW